MKYRYFFTKVLHRLQNRFITDKISEFEQNELFFKILNDPMCKKDFLQAHLHLNINMFLRIFCIGYGNIKNKYFIEFEQ